MDFVNRVQSTLRRRLLIEIVRDTEGAGGIAFFGAHPWRLTLVRRAFGPTATVQSTFRPRQFDLLAQARACAARYGMAVVAGPPPDARPSLDAFALRVPRFVAQGQSIPLDERHVRAMLTQSRVQGDLRRLKKHQYEWSISRDPALLTRFYGEFYVPTVSGRHGDEATILSQADLGAGFGQGGEFLLVSKAGNVVAMALNTREGNAYATRKGGVLGGDVALIKDGAMSAVDMFTLLRACQLGCPRVSAGLSLPFLSDGVLLYKAKWNYGLEVDREYLGSYYFLLDRRHPFARRFLARNPMIFVDGAGLSALTSPEPESGEPTDAIGDWVPGLRRRLPLNEVPLPDLKTLRSAAGPARPRRWRELKWAEPWRTS